MPINIDNIRQTFQSDRYAAQSGIEIDSATQECVVCSMQLTASHMNAAGGVQGGAIFTLADLAFAVHSNLEMVCGKDVGATVGQSYSISYLKATKGTRLIAESECVSKGRNVSVYRVRVHDDLGVPIAEMLANGFKTQKR